MALLRGDLNINYSGVNSHGQVSEKMKHKNLVLKNML
jgi:hypothetical protein